MSLPALRGHRETRALLARARAGGRLSQSVLLHGAAGIGKERLGLWLAQLILCEVPAEEPCGACQACRLAVRLEHPDLHWFFPLPRPEGVGSPEKLRERLEEHRASELQLRREHPYHEPRYERAPAHFLASIRTLQQVSSVRPSIGSRKVFVIGDAELMVPQESSPEAANAFLKLLEEPPRETSLILTSSQPGALLPTIRSRVVAIRVPPIPEPEIRSLLVMDGLAEEAAAERIARLARGSVRRALHLAGRGDRGDAADDDRQAARTLLLAALASGDVARLAAAHEHKPSGARADLVAPLEALADELRDLLAVVSGAPEGVADSEALPILQRAADRSGTTPAGVIGAIERVMAARELALGNVNPQLIVADLLRGVQRALTGT